MSEQHKLINHDFQQADTATYTRIMQDREELVQYHPNSHTRIWLNSEPQNYESHYHSCVEILFMHEGESQTKTPTKNISQTTGDILIIPPYVMHHVINTKPARQFVILLDVELLVHFGIFSPTSSSINDILLCNKDNCPQIYDSIRNNIIDMINAYFTASEYWEMEVYSYLFQMISTLARSGIFRKPADLLKEGSTAKEHYDKFAELLQYLEMNFSEPLSLDDASSHVGFSKYHFIRLFKEYTGTTFYEYLTNKRIQHAKELLETNMGITEIAFSCGFNNQTSFCRTFKKEVGCPPTEYRQHIKE